VQFDVKAFKRQLEEEIELMAMSEPEKAKVWKSFLFSNDTFVDKAMSRVIPPEEIKYYPGSIKGPEPEDDPDSYAKWYVEHQPLSAFPDGKLNPADLGVKYKFLKQRDDAEEAASVLTAQPANHIFQRYEQYFLDVDELYPTKDRFDGNPEWAIFKKDNFGKRSDEKSDPEVFYLS